MIDGMRAIARSCGYALAVHGSQLRDLDLIACPWVAWAIPAERLVQALVVGLELHVASTPATRLQRGRDEKPHGRLAWSLLKFTAACWEVGDDWRPPRAIDLSVMPVGNPLELRSRIHHLRNSGDRRVDSEFPGCRW